MMKRSEKGEKPNERRRGDERRQIIVVYGVNWGGIKKAGERM